MIAEASDAGLVSAAYATALAAVMVVWSVAGLIRHERREAAKTKRLTSDAADVIAGNASPYGRVGTKR